MIYSKFVIYDPKLRFKKEIKSLAKQIDFDYIDSDIVAENLIKAIAQKKKVINVPISDFIINLTLRNEKNIVAVTVKSNNKSHYFELNKKLITETNDILKNKDFCMTIHFIERELLNIKVHRKLLLVSKFQKNTKNSDTQIIALYDSKERTKNIKAIKAKSFIDYTNKLWIDELKSQLISKQRDYKEHNYFEIVNYHEYFDKNRENTNIEQIRSVIKPEIAEIKNSTNKIFDPFDLEIQSLISSTSLKKDELYKKDTTLNTSRLKKLVKHQLSIILNRYKKFEKTMPIEELLTPQGIFKEETRYWRHKGKIFAVPVKKSVVDKSRAVEIEFKIVDKNIALGFEQCFHYIHNDRNFDIAFGLFVKGQKYPYAISLLDFMQSRKEDFKIRFLKQAGINTKRCIDEIRLYSFPWVPQLSSSLLADLVQDYISTNYPNITTTITAVNRNLFKGTYIMQAGYIPLALKPTNFYFEQRTIDDEKIYYYQGSKGITLDYKPFALLPTVEYYRPVKESIKLNIDEGNVFRIRQEQYD